MIYYIDIIDLSHITELKQMSFTLLHTKKKHRQGILRLAHGAVKTPFFMPIATRGFVKSLTSDDVKKLGAEIILSNTYHLLQRPGIEFLKKHDGLHGFMGWNKPILTDSGGYQVFSLSKFRKITAEGVTFMSEIDGRKIFLSPEKVIEAQFAIGSDVMMCLDVCAPWPCTYKNAASALESTLDWARRSKKHFNALLKRKKIPIAKQPLLFGIVQGSLYKSLRKRCIAELTRLDFDGYGIGGVAPKKKVIEFVEWCTALLPKDKPRYLMGVGRPEDIVEAVAVGVDMFDCVIPTREARHGLLYVKTSPARVQPKIQKLFYKTLRIKQERYANDLKPLATHCSCYTCRSTRRAYLRHLFITQDALFMRLASIHNLAFYLDMMRELQN